MTEQIKPIRKTRAKRPFNPNTKKAKWCYRKAEVITHYGKLAPRLILVDKTTGATWTYVHEAWEARVVRSGSKYVCWDWKGSWHRQSMGIFNVHRFNDTRKSGQMTIQRFSMAIHLDRPLRDTEKIVSECKNPACCNPHHLRIKHHSNPIYEGKYSDEWLNANKDFILNNRQKVISEKFKLTYNQAVYLKTLCKNRTASS